MYILEIKHNLVGASVEVTSTQVASITIPATDDKKFGSAGFKLSMYYGDEMKFKAVDEATKKDVGEVQLTFDD